MGQEGGESQKTNIAVLIAWNEGEGICTVYRFKKEVTRKRGVVFLREGKGRLISSMPIMAIPQIKCSGAAQSTWLEQLGTLAAQQQYGKPLGYGGAL